VEFNRHHYFAAGIVVLLLGVQLRMVESYVLNDDATRWLMSKSSDPAVKSVGAVSQMFPAAGPQTPRKTIVPPLWAGWAALSLGSVLVLHSLALPRPS
jgi:hypothetical protein